MTDNKNFLGIPVEGEFYAGSERVQQRPLEEFAPLLSAVLDDPFIAEVGWNQYTPYFNDGEPCEFGVGEVWVRTVEDGTYDEDQDGYVDEYTDNLSVSWGQHPSLGGLSYPGRAYVGPDRERWERAKALSDAVINGEFEDVLLGAFGDHASVVVRRDGITVDTYEHD